MNDSVEGSKMGEPKKCFKLPKEIRDATNSSVCSQSEPAAVFRIDFRNFSHVSKILKWYKHATSAPDLGLADFFTPILSRFVTCRVLLRHGEGCESSVLYKQRIFYCGAWDSGNHRKQ